MTRPFAAEMIVFGAFWLAAAGCHSTHVGAPCSLDVPGDAGAPPETATINPTAPECPGAICVLPASDAVTGTGPLCSADCSTDSDCSDSETTHDLANPRCKSGFACAVLTTVGPFCCRKLCACRDFFSGPIETPLACMPGGGCPNVH